VDLAKAISRSFPGLPASATEPDRISYSRDLWPRRLIDVRAGELARSLPGAIVWPRSTEEVAMLVGFARAEGIPLVPFGAGSGVCGGIAPDEQTLVLDLKRMNDFSLDEGPSLSVGPGALGITLEEDLERRGYTIGHFPSSILCSTVGGWVAARGAGQCSGLYGKIEDMVVSLECVLGSGEVVVLRRRNHAPNLLPLVIGSEGTLAVITRASLRLHPAPRSRSFAAFGFGDIVGGWNALRELFQSGLRPAVSRLYDPIDSVMLRQGSLKPERPAASVAARRGTRKHRLGGVLRSALRAPRALNAAIQAAEGNLLGGSTMVLVFEGESDEVELDRDRALALCRSLGATYLGEGPAQAWYRHRYSVSYRQSPVFRMGAFSDTMEVAAPWSRLEALYDGVRRALGKHVLVMAHLSHAYPDGCSIYFTFSAVAGNDGEAVRLYENAWQDALSAALEAGGTLSHHHGVGRSKAPRLGSELGFGVELVRRMQRAWDPAGILNPGNLVPRTDEAPAASYQHPARGVDVTSLLATFGGEQTLGEAEATLAEHGLTLGLQEGFDPAMPIGRFVAAGLPGSADRWQDPVWQPLAGLVARLHTGDRLEIRPAPRRAVGPDLSALFMGAGERIGVIEEVCLCVHRRDARPARALPFDAPREPSLSAGEDAAWENLVRAAGAG
jgi:alkyldihydroxyacetonephosphate synthase